MPTAINYASSEYKLDKKTVIEFSGDFSNAVNLEIEADGGAWENCNKIFGTICEKIKKSNDADYVTVSIKDDQGEDGGYIHVYGWSEVIV